jgi:DNA-binding HxlR family transcriptional regulator
METFNFISFIRRWFAFRNIRKKISGISNKMFTHTVRELEKDGLVLRKVFPVVPPKVEYKLSHRGKSLENILKSLDKWGLEDIQD